MLSKSLGQGPYVQTVQNAEAPDLKGLNPWVQSYIVFDNVNDMKFALDARVLFQANTDFHTGPHAWREPDGYVCLPSLAVACAAGGHHR